MGCWRNVSVPSGGNKGSLELRSMQGDDMTFSIHPIALVKALRASPADDYWGGALAHIELTA